MKKETVLSVAALAASVSLAACGSTSVDSTAPLIAAGPAIRTPASVVTPAQTTVAANSELPDSVPIPTDFTKLSVAQEPNGDIKGIYSANMAPADIIGFYTKALPNYGWTITDTDYDEISARKATEKVEIDVRPIVNGTQIEIDYDPY